MAVQLYWYLAAALCLQSAIVCRGSMVGGWSDVDPNREDVQEIANFAVKKHNEKSNDLFNLKLIRIITAKTQVVSGTNYAVTVELGRTQCRKNGSSGYGIGQSCDVANSEVSQVYVCTLVVYNRPWPKGEEIQNLQSSSCEPQ
ncbi:cystatin-like [Mixophyes fleayi]|uniref:cystatin-like n=1 Tax=Mixophyes fleayi TaxID=3061075 RepID=UPI003F4D7584